MEYEAIQVYRDQSEDEKDELRVGVTERVAKSAGCSHSAVKEAHLVAELRATLVEVVGTPVWIVMWPLDQCVDSAFGLMVDIRCPSRTVNVV